MVESVRNLTLDQRLGYLSDLSARTSLLAIDTMLCLIPASGRIVDAAIDAAQLAKRMQRASTDLALAMDPHSPDSFCRAP